MASPGVDAWDVGRQRAARETGSFSYRNATLIEQDGIAAGCLIGYPIPDLPVEIATDLPAIFVPLQELENLASATWYVNVLAVRPELRRQGLGQQLLAQAEHLAVVAGLNGMSVIVSDANLAAKALYERCGYRLQASRVMVKDGWPNDGRNWILLTKRI